MSDKLKCPKCGNERFFYSEVSVMAKKLIDQSKGARDGKIIEVDRSNEDNNFLPVYCYTCGELVEG